LAIDLKTKAIELLVDTVHGKKLLVCNNPSVAQDGTIYFSDSSQRYPLSHIKREIIEHVATGRLLRRNTNGSVDVLLENLQFANGVVLAPDESFVLVAETGACKINRVWLKGAKKGQAEVFADNLPGMPDNMSLGTDGLFWVALPSAEDARLQLLHRLPLALRKAIAKIPESLLPAEQRSFLAMAFNSNGKCVRFIEGDPLRFHLVTGVREYQGKLYAGSIEENAIAVITLPK
jgi:sugar lactone lactonase YvrE